MEVFQRFFLSLYFRNSLYKLYFLQGNFTIIIYISFKITADFTWSDKFAIQKLNLIFSMFQNFSLVAFIKSYWLRCETRKNIQFEELANPHQISSLFSYLIVYA